MRMFRNTVSFWTIIVCVLAIVGCPRQNEPEASEIKTFVAGSLHVPASKDVESSIYIDAANDSTSPYNFTEQLKSLLISLGCRLVQSPSEAGYIFHITIVDEGETAQDRLAALVAGGYGSEGKFSGQGAKALAADALLVQRRVPAEQRPSQTRLKNISARNALGSNQMRVGLLADGMEQAGIERQLAETMAKLLGEAVCKTVRGERPD